MELMLTKGIKFSDFEDIRSQILGYLDNLESEEIRSRVIEAMVTFKATMQ